MLCWDDGMHSAEALSNIYTIEGYELKPILDLPITETNIKVKVGTTEAVAYFEVGNKGQEKLDGEFSPADEGSTLVSPLFLREYTFEAGRSQVDCHTFKFAYWRGWKHFNGNNYFNDK